MGQKDEKDKRNIRDRQVMNNITFGHDEMIKILSGSNMSGKTHLEKMIIWNILSAQVSGFAPADRVKMPIFSRVIYLDRVTEKMFRDLSSYGHEVEFWKAFFKLFDNAEGPTLVLGVTDELFSTASPLYQSALSFGVAEEVLRRGGLMVVASHNHDFIDAFAKTYPDKSKIWHLRTRITREDGKVKVNFDRVLERGHDLSNAIDIAESMGLGMITELIPRSEKEQKTVGDVGEKSLLRSA